MELLSPAGNYEKLKAAAAFGADAVYFAGPSYGLRANAGNFTLEEMETALKFLHSEGKKGYVTVNVFPRTEEMCDMGRYIKKCEKMGADGLIISDPGVFSIAMKEGVKIPIFISTQANVTNLSAVEFWASMGAARVITARELRKNELEEIIKKSPCEIEAFIHGAMCVSMSGRCLISAYMTRRDANRGECAHPCRWNYSLEEETRKGEHYPVFEDERGTYLYNSKDLSLLERIGELEKMGLTSGKIEGRMKSVMYASIVTGVYRAAIDRARQDPEAYFPDPFWRELLECVSNRGYTEGFYSDAEDAQAINGETGGYRRGASFLGLVTGWKEGMAKVSCRAKFAPGEKASFITPGLKKIDITLSALYDEESVPALASRPNFSYYIPAEKDIPAGSLLMRFEKWNLKNV